jgi:hypothetical protein
MIAVKTELVAHPQQNDNDAGHSHRQTGNVEDGMNPMPTDISNRSFEVVGKHFKRLKVQDSRFLKQKISIFRCFLIPFGAKGVPGLILPVFGS